jgi:hypothetical protein
MEWYWGVVEPRLGGLLQFLPHAGCLDAAFIELPPQIGSVVFLCCVRPDHVNLCLQLVDLLLEVLVLDYMVFYLFSYFINVCHEFYLHFF